MKSKVELNKVINQIITSKKIRWVWGIEAAKSIVGHATICKSISEIVSHENVKSTLYLDSMMIKISNFGKRTFKFR